MVVQPRRRNFWCQEDGLHGRLPRRWSVVLRSLLSLLAWMLLSTMRTFENKKGWIAMVSRVDARVEATHSLLTLVATLGPASELGVY